MRRRAEVFFRDAVLRLRVPVVLRLRAVVLRLEVLRFAVLRLDVVRFTVLRLGGGGFAPYEPVRLYRGREPDGTALRLLHADAAGNVPLLQVLAVCGAPRNRLAYTLVGMQSGARATAFYTPHATGQRKPARTAGR